LKASEVSRLIEGIKSGDKKAYAQVFIEYSDYCIKTLQKKTGCSKYDAEDVFMDSLIAFQQRLLKEQTIEIKNIRNYLYTSCINLWISKRKKSSREEFYSEGLKQLSFIDNVNEEVEYRESLNIAAKKAIANLSKKCKEIINLFYFEKRNMKDIADMMNFSDFNVAKTTKSRCFKKLMMEAESILKSHKDISNEF